MIDSQQIERIPELRGRQFSIAPMEGGLTNRNYRLETENETLVLRVAGKDTSLLGIDRECEAACSRKAAALGVGPEVIAVVLEEGILVRRFLRGRVLAAEDVRDSSTLGRLVQGLRRYHDSGPGPGSFSPFATVRQYHSIACRHQVSFPAELDRALELLARIESEAEAGDPPCPCHNDLLPANFIDDGTILSIIDWEYAGMGDRFFDLGNLAVNCAFDGAHERTLLELYFGEVRPDSLRRLRLMRLASDFREAMWGFLQSAVSTLDEDYLAYGCRHLNRFLDSATRVLQQR